ncbi:MAG TPA: host attachment protein [Gammaproteobacteria bacterium]|jgi:protein required for attachment to host cells|nr:host attachment protein [Gammaproteobacteria bacterium]
MAKIWIVVADAAYARILECEQLRSDPIELEVMMNPAARQKEQDLRSSKPGRGFISSGEGRHQYSSEVDPRRHEADQFAQSVVTRLTQALEAKAFADLMLIASPSFLGLLRKHLTSQLSNCVKQEINKDLVRMDVKDIMAHLR